MSTLKKITEYVFDHGKNRDENGFYVPIIPSDFTRPLTHEEMDYNLALAGEMIKNYAIRGNNSTNIYEMASSDIGKTLVFRQDIQGNYFWNVEAVDAGGPTGPQGLTGGQGPTGPTGAQGSQGRQGPAGPQGIIGVQGSTGPQGSTGGTGAQGNTGRQGDTGAQGAQGNTGISSRWYAGNGPAPGPYPGPFNEGDLYLDLDTGEIYSADNANHFLPTGANIMGPMGMQGSVGAQGITGAQGSTGIQGATGAQGVTGSQGAIGTQGVTGSQGLTGTQGNQGRQGPTGPQGDAGTTGSQGDTGYGFEIEQIFNDLNQLLTSPGITPGKFGLVAGILPQTDPDYGALYLWDGSTWTYVTDMSVQGAAGVQGPSGAQGTTGAQGNNGQQGATGSQGNQGPIGQQGATGNQGATGAQGNQGPTGLQGSTGAQGATGSQGANGTQGYTGAQGNQGPLGFQGSTGAQGTTGSQGNQGFQGPTGSGQGQIYYFNESIVSIYVDGGANDLNEVSNVPTATGEVIVTTTIAALQSNKLISRFITPAGAFATTPFIPAGEQQFHTHWTLNSVNDQVQVSAKLIRANSLGVPIATIGTTNPELVGWNLNNTTPVSQMLSVYTPQTTMDPTDRVIVELYLTNDDNANRTVKFYTEGLQNYSHCITTLGATTGSTGAQGAQGNQGPTGTGAQGATGSQGNQGPTGLQGATGVQGFTGAQGSTGTQGAQGPLGFQGATGLQGSIGAQGNQGPTGATGAQGNQGPTGLQGLTGPQGVQGNIGNQGNQGPTGAQGNQGPTGAQGNQGRQGPTGPQGNIGAQGFQGDIGQGFRIYQIYNSVADLLNDGSAPTGEFGLVAGTLNPSDPDYGALYLWDGATWTYITDMSVQGAAGIQGLTGPQGTTGTQGNQGPIGSQGNQGPIGLQGIIGAQGNQGPIGLTGPQGNVGAQGATGFQGITGGTGAQGTQGRQGPVGAQGTQGFQGITGDGASWHNGIGTPTPSPSDIEGDYYLDTDNGDVWHYIDAAWTPVANIKGAEGAQGNQGPTGLLGSIGFQGRQGPTGIAGNQGNTGAQGNQGPTGLQGTTGSQGNQGPTGPQGNTGSQGFQGNQGPTGLQGTNGSNGTQGNQGPTGSTGAQGNQGPIGVQGFNGVNGAQGNQGPTGSQGSTGTQGSTGVGFSITYNRVLYVDPNGNNGTAVIGDPTNPFATIYRAIEVGLLEFTNSPFTVYINSGDYIDTLTNGLDLVLSGAGNQTVSLEFQDGANWTVDLGGNGVSSGANLFYLNQGSKLNINGAGRSNNYIACTNGVFVNSGNTAANANECSVNINDITISLGDSLVNTDRAMFELNKTRLNVDSATLEYRMDGSLTIVKKLVYFTNSVIRVKNSTLTLDSGYEADTEMYPGASGSLSAAMYPWILFENMNDSNAIDIHRIMIHNSSLSVTTGGGFICTRPYTNTTDRTLLLDAVYMYSDYQIISVHTLFNDNPSTNDNYYVGSNSISGGKTPIGNWTQLPPDSMVPNIITFEMPTIKPY